MTTNQITPRFHAIEQADGGWSVFDTRYIDSTFAIGVGLIARDLSEAGAEQLANTLNETQS